MKYKLSIALYTTEEVVPYEYHREKPTGNSILYKDEIPLVLSQYQSNSLNDIKNQAEIIEKYGRVLYIDVTVKATALDTFILSMPDVYDKVVSQLEKFDCDIKVSSIGNNISFQLTNANDLDTRIQKSLFVVNTEIMQKEQLISRRGMIKVFDELIEPESYRITINKIRSIIITERLKKPNNFTIESVNLGDILVKHKDSNRIVNYLSKITGKPVLPVGSSLLIDADFDDIRNTIKVSREECTNEIAYIITERRYHIDPLLYLKCYRDLMNVDKQIDSLL